MPDEIVHDEEAANRAWDGITPHYLDGWQTHVDGEAMKVNAHADHQRGWNDREQQFSMNKEAQALAAKDA